MDTVFGGLGLMDESLGKVQRRKDGRYTVERRDGALLSLPFDQWVEAVGEMQKQEALRSITVSRQSSENSG